MGRMGIIFPIYPMLPILPILLPLPPPPKSLLHRSTAVGQTRLEHPLAQTALLQEFLFQPPKLLIQQIVGLVNQAYGNVGDQ